MRNRFVLVAGGLFFVSAFSALPSIPIRQEARRPPSRADEQPLKLAKANELSDQLLDLFLKDKFRDGIKLAERIEQIHAQAPANGQVEHAISLNNLGVLYHSSADYGRAEPCYRRALEIFKPTLGEEHADYVTAFNNLAVLQGLKGDYAAALPLYRRALELRGKAVGEKHPDYVRSLNNLAWLHKAMGDYASAEPVYLKALKLHQQGLSYGRPNARILEIYRQVDLRKPPGAGNMQTDLALILGNLAVLYHEKGDYTRAEPFYRQTLEIYQQTVGETHSLYARNLNNLAGLYQLMGDDARAEDLLQKAVVLRKKALGEKHLDYATTLHNLGRFYHMIEDYDRAEPLYLQALAIRKEALGDKHPYYGQTLDKLAWLYHAKGDYQRAEPLYAEALEVRTHAFGDKHRYDATIVTNQALLYQAMGNHQKAEALFRKSLAWTKNQVGDQNGEYARTLHHLGMLHFALKNDDAEGLARAALDISRKLLEQCASIQSERQQLAMMQTTRFYLDGYLSMTAEAKTPAERVYVEILAWKGAVTIRQQTMRRLRQTLEKDGKNDALKLYHDLEQATRKLAALSQAQSTGKQPENPRQELERLSGEIERLEQTLAGVSEEFRRGRAQQRRSPADIARALPADAILIDLLEYNRSTAPAAGTGEFQAQRALTAFVVCKDRPIQRIDLGPVLPIADAVDGLRQALVRNSQGREVGQSLRRLLWEPLAKHVAGAKVVLISPDGAVARLPWSVLPGQKPGAYLLEEYAIAIVPVPAQLPELMARPKDAGATPSLLLVGDVNFDAWPGTAKDLAFARAAPHTTRHGTALNWGRLPGTQAEVAAIKSTFQKRFANGSVTDLRQDQATEEEVRVQAPQHRYLHLATHGFFASSGRAAPPPSRGNQPSTRAARTGADIAGLHPGLMSGLVLAGSNQPVQPERDDGILTALEVSQLNLADAELAVLSACETGLGETTGGEGLLGLQRAFQMAGARSVVAGLWKVPDRGTQALMQRFYDNLWRHNLGKLAALREAQLWMLREGEQVPGVVRGLGFEDAPPVKDGRLPPYYWGAFSLSGDWR